MLEVNGTQDWKDKRSTWAAMAVLTIGIAVWAGLNMRAFAELLLEAIEYREIPWGLDYVMGLFWWAILAIALFVFGGESHRMLLVAWLGKLFVTLAAMLVYERFYSLDSYGYYNLQYTGQHWMYPGIDFRDDLLPSTVGSVTKSSQSGGIGLENTIRVMLLLSFITGPFYHAMKVWTAFMGLLGIWFFYRAVVTALGRPVPPVFYVLAFFPSVIFWGSTLGKDPIQLLFLGLYAYGGAMLIAEGRLSAVGFLGVGLFGAYLLRPWMAGMAAGTLFIALLLGQCRRSQKVSALILVVVVAAVAWPFLARLGLNLNDFGLMIALEALETKGMGYAHATQQAKITGSMTGGLGGSGEDILDVTGQMLTTPLPVAMFGGLFRPLPFDVTNPFTAMVAVENTAVLIAAASALFHFRLTYFRNPLLLWLLLFCLAWTTLYGYIVLANFGSGVRYKLQVWPFLLLLLICLTHREGRAWLDSWRPERR